MSFNWENKNVSPISFSPESPMEMNEEVVDNIMEDPETNLFDEEEADTAELMTDANLRLEQGRLYQMIMKHDLFGETDADPKAIRNVQREIRKFVRERMETMLGIRQEILSQTPIISSPFNDLEVTMLKMVASKASGGRTEQLPAPVIPQTPAAPKKDGISTISGTLRPNSPTPLSRAPSKPLPKPQAKPKPVAKSALSSKPEESALQKPIDQMSPEELAAHDKAALERRSRNYAAMPTNLVPHPTPQALEMMYSGMVNTGNVSLSSNRPYRLE